MIKDEQYYKYIDYIINRIKETYNYAPGVLQDNIDGVKAMLLKYKNHNMAESVYNLIKNDTNIGFDEIAKYMVEELLSSYRKNLE